MCAPSRPTARRGTWRPFCGACDATCGAMSSSCGIVVLFTRALGSRPSSAPIPASISKCSRRMPPNSIRSSSSGTTSKATQPIACHAICGTSAAVCGPTPAAFGVLRQNCARSFCLLHYLLRREKLFITSNNSPPPLIVTMTSLGSLSPRSKRRDIAQMSIELWHELLRAILLTLTLYNIYI